MCDCGRPIIDEDWGERYHIGEVMPIKEGKVEVKYTWKTGVKTPKGSAHK